MPESKEDLWFDLSARASSMRTSYSYEGSSILYSNLGFLEAMAEQARLESPTAEKIVVLQNNAEISHTNAELIGLVKDMTQKYQNTFAVEAALYDLIDNETITEYEDLETAYNSGISGAVNPSLLPDLRTLVEDLAAVEGGLEAWASGMNTAVANKVDKVTGKGLSKNDFTDAYKAQLDAIVSRSFSNPSRTLNSGFQPSTTRDALCSYSVDVSCSLSLTTGQSGTVFLEYADDSGFTTNLKEVARFVNANSGSLTVGLNLTQAVTGTLSGIVPANKYARLRTANNTGTPTFTYRSGQEVLL